MMGIWGKIFGSTNENKSEKSPYLPAEIVPLEISFAKNFTTKGGRFLYCETPPVSKVTFEKICADLNCSKVDVFSLDKKLSSRFGSSFVCQNSGSLISYKAALMNCEHAISNTGKILLSEHQIKHFNLSDFPNTIIVLATLNQLVSDVSQGMTLLKNKYGKEIPTNITTLKLPGEEKKNNNGYNAKNIYLLLEDSLIK